MWTLGRANRSAQAPSLSHFKLGASLGIKEKGRTPLSVSILLPKLPLAFQISEFLGAIKPDTSEQEGKPLISWTTNFAQR